MFLMEGLRNAEDVQNQEISDIVCLVQSGRAENGSVQHIFERGENLHWLFCEVEEPLMRLISGTENGQGICLLYTWNHLIGETAICYGLSPVIKWFAW